jgi:hypothetical protein
MHHMNQFEAVLPRIVDLTLYEVSVCLTCNSYMEVTVRTEVFSIMLVYDRLFFRGFLKLAS